MENKLIYDNAGRPSIMVPVPKFNLSEVIAGAPNAPHPAFIVGGKEIDEVWISKYQNIVIDGRAYSVQLQEPKDTISFDEAVAACESKGPGWHLMTNAEWAAIALWAKKHGTLPHGNNNQGFDYAHPEEQGITYDGYRTLTGSGPTTWTHDHTTDGIYDLNGNLLEWVGGVRWLDGELQIIPDNNAAVGADQSKDSKAWQLIAAGDSTIKYRIAEDGMEITTEKPDKDWGGCYFRDLKAPGIEIPDILKALALYPADSEQVDGYFFVNTDGERLAFRGGLWNLGALAGVFCANGSYSRSISSMNIGFRSAFIGKSGICGPENLDDQEDKQNA
jgi:sulfatase modifying factor 1